MADLFVVDVHTVNEYPQNISSSGELRQQSGISGWFELNKQDDLQAIISVSSTTSPSILRESPGGQHAIEVLTGKARISHMITTRPWKGLRLGEWSRGCSLQTKGNSVGFWLTRSLRAPHLTHPSTPILGMQLADAHAILISAWPPHGAWLGPWDRPRVPGLI